MCLHFCHYFVRLSKNLLTYWPTMDVGRHGTQYQLSKACKALCYSRLDCHDAIDIMSNAVLCISLDYASIKPYGRVEPLNTFIVAVGEVASSGYEEQAIQMAEFLGAIRARTSQISNARSEEYISQLPPKYLQIFTNTAEKCKADYPWLPIDVGDSLWPLSTALSPR